MKTFTTLYAEHGPDTMAIAEALGISEAKAEGLIYDHMNANHAARMHAVKIEREAAARLRAKERSASRAKPARVLKTDEEKAATKQAYNARTRAGLAEIRGRHA